MHGAPEVIEFKKIIVDACVKLLKLGHTCTWHTHEVIKFKRLFSSGSVFLEVE